MQTQSGNTPAEALQRAAEPVPEQSTRQQTASLLDTLVANVSVLPGSAADAENRAAASIQQFQQATTWVEQLCLWCRQAPRSAAELLQLKRSLVRDIGQIDQLLTGQVNAILHHPDFQRLEASWRGLWHLCDTNERQLAENMVSDRDQETKAVKIRLLSVSKRELKRDFDKSAEFDQSVVFHKVYEEEFGMAGGTPYGVLVADYEFRNHPDDLDLLEKLSGVGAAAFAPVLAGAHPSLLGLDSFDELQSPLELEHLAGGPKHQRWQSLREHPDTQFLGLTMPHVLMRSPYRDDGSQAHGFRFEEQVSLQSKQNYLWGSAAWALAGVLLRAYRRHRWFADIRGAMRAESDPAQADGGGLVEGFPSLAFRSDSSASVRRSSVDVCLSDQQDGQLCDLGFVPLSDCKDTSYCAFYSNQSVHQPRTYDDDVATANARVSAMLQYVLCCCRIAHFLKIKARDKLGSQLAAIQIQNQINDWLIEYVTPDDKAHTEIKARYPLRQAEVEVTEIAGQPGQFQMQLRLQPHYQLDQLTSSMTLISRHMEFQNKG